MKNYNEENEIIDVTDTPVTPGSFEKRLDFSKMTAEEFLRSAVMQAAGVEIAELEAMDIEVPEPTEEQRREIKELRDGASVLLASP